MVDDARFEDGTEDALRLMALDAEGLQIVSALTQDAVFPIGEMKWQPGKQRFALLVNRFRWEDKDQATAQGRKVERVQAMVVFESVLKVATSGIDRSDTDTILSLLEISFAAGKDAQGRVELTLAGDGAIALDVECLDVSLRDVTRPYVAPSGSVPSHE